MSADMKELSAYGNVKSKLGGDVFQRPRGSDAGFPDFGISVDGIDCHFEYKMDWKAQMSGLSSWYYDGTFRTNVSGDESSRIIRLMQRNSKLKENAKFLLETGKSLLGRVRGIKLNSTMLGDKKASLVSEYDSMITGRKVLGRVSSSSVSSMIIDIYKKKFTDNKRTGKSVCFMYIDDKLWLLDQDGCTNDEIMNIVRKLNPKAKKINRFALRDCYLEVRISPRPNGRLDTRALCNLTSNRSIVYKGTTIG